MNKKLGLAVAGALLAASASAQAGITIPAGDWTVDIGGNVNAYYSYNKLENNASGTAAGSAGSLVNSRAAAGLDNNQTTITTGLLPAFLSVSGKSRQNDLDIGFTISIQPGVATSNSLSSAGQENRQAFLTFGDASWGTVKVGRDLGIFASTAILSDMTLLGVGAAGTNTAGTTTLGGIGFGYVYADWKAQVSYTSPNWNGFQFSAGVMQPWNINSFGNGSDASVANRSTSVPGFEAQATYAWTGDVSGKVWAGLISQRVEDITSFTTSGSTTTWGTNHGNETARGFDVGANVNVGGLGLTAYWYDGKGLGTTGFLNQAFDANGKRRDSDGGYLQATYTLPTATKVGVAYGVSNLDRTSTDRTANLDLLDKHSRVTVGVYHPLTKSLNLVAEYNRTEAESHKAGIKDAQNDNYSLGAILFF